MLIAGWVECKLYFSKCIFAKCIFVKFTPAKLCEFILSAAQLVLLEMLLPLKREEIYVPLASSSNDFVSIISTPLISPLALSGSLCATLSLVEPLEEAVNWQSHNFQVTEEKIMEKY